MGPILISPYFAKRLLFAKVYYNDNYSDNDNDNDKNNDNDKDNDNNNDYWMLYSHYLLTTINILTLT